MARVGLVIPLFNKERFVGRALGSVLAQTYQDFEVVAVDDGSTDDGAAVVARCGDPRVRLIRQENAGPGAARNRGLRETAAPLVTFLDADDEWLPEFLAKSVKRLDRHPSCVLAAAGAFVSSGSGSERVSMEQSHRRRGITTGPWRLPPKVAPRATVLAIECFHSSATVCRREVVERYGGYYEKNHCTYGEDSYLWFQIAVNHTVYWDPAPLAWLHQEDSALGVGRKTVTPLRPILTDPDPIWRVTPPQYRPVLEHAFAYYALCQALERGEVGRRREASELLRRFPLARSWRWSYLRRRLQSMRDRARRLSFC